MFSRFHWRTSRNREIVEHTTSSPWSASSRQVRLLRLADRSRSSPEWPRSSAIASRSTSPSRKTAGRPADRKRDHSSRPTVVLPDPERPVIQKTSPVLAAWGGGAAATEAGPTGVVSATGKPVLLIDSTGRNNIEHSGPFGLLRLFIPSLAALIQRDALATLTRDFYTS